MDRTNVKHSETFCLLVRALQLGGGYKFREIEERAGDGGDRYAIDAGAIVGMESLRRVHVDSLALASATRDRDVGPASPAAQQAVQRGGLAMAQQRPGSEREHGSHPPTAWRGEQPKGVDAAMDAP
jgi:hypothetical protein